MTTRRHRLSAALFAATLALIFVTPNARAAQVLSVASIADLCAMDPAALEDGQQVSVMGYHAGSDAGGGIFCWDADCTRADNGGTVFAADDTADGRWVRVGVDAIEWADFGVTGDTVTAEAFQAPFDYGIANGLTDFVLPDHEITVTGPVRFTIPEGVSGPIRISGDGRIRFEYPWPDEQRQILFRIVGNGSATAEIRLDLNGAGMGRYPDQLRVMTGLRLDALPGSTLRLHVEEMYGYGLRVYECPGADLYVTAINCDGQKVTKAPDTGAYDNYGDGIYVATTDVTLHSPMVTTVNGGRGGIVFESFDSRTSGIVLNPRVSGYDRGIHVEGNADHSGNVRIEGGEIRDCNAGVWNFSAGGVVTCRGVAFENTRQISQNVIGRNVVGYVSTYGSASKTVTEGCTFRRNQHPVESRAISCSGTHVSTGDGFEALSGRIDSYNATRFSLSEFTGHSDAEMKIGDTATATISDGVWSGSILLPGTDNFRVANVVMQAPDGQRFCGTIASINKQGGMISHVEFHNPESYCIDNYRIQVGGALPVYEAITAIRETPASSPRILRYEPAANGRHDYRSSLPSYIRDEVNGGVKQIPPRSAN